MDVIRKCTVCGSTNFVSIGLSDSDGGAIMESINAFACTKCGHVEFFVKEEYLQAKVEEEEQRTLAALKKESDRKELMKLREEREKLLSIAEDEDQT
ncbi:MAG: hypothetical protein J6O90_00145, partial [Candidatus Methanomethylophilaceae archaeon]|nr:hypothetical protein [Candidatus Methanomethylophilaceae archaeon]